jgi:hypothetical protein
MNQIGFQVAEYDASLPLVVDPILVYSTYLGGSGLDQAQGIAVDSSGNAYVTGSTSSPDFPMANPSQVRYGGAGSDAFVTKLSASGNALVYSTHLGGRATDVGYGIAVDSAGNAYLTGTTDSTDFPTANSFQALHAGGINDAFVTKLNPSGNALVYSTYLGGGGSDAGYGIAVDSFANAYVTGSTSSIDFPTMNSLADYGGGVIDAFVTKLNPSGKALVYSTYLGGSGDDAGYGIAVDSVGNACVTGSTSSPDFPTASPLQARYGGAESDAFVTKLNAPGSMLVYSTYLGGNGVDAGYGIALDSAGNAYVTGSTSSPDFPTASPFQVGYGGAESDAFVTKLNAAGNALVYSSYLGGNGIDAGYGIAVDSFANAYVAGSTSSSNFPLINPFPARNADKNVYAFLTKLSAATNAPLYSTYFGGGNQDICNGIAVDSSRNAYLAGWTGSTNFPTANPLQAHYAGAGDAFVSKIGEASAFSFFPQVAAGGGYSTFFTITNTGATAASGNLILTDQQGLPLTVSSELGLGSSFALTIPSGGTFFLTANPLSAGDPPRSGWARLESLGGSLTALGTFQYVAGGSLQTIAGVQQAQPLQFATIAVDNDDSQQMYTGYAAANPTSQNISINIAVVDQNGSVVDDSLSIPLGPGQQIARYLHQDLPARLKFRGSMVLRVRDGYAFVAAALLQKQGRVTVVPVIPGKAPNVPN